MDYVWEVHLLCIISLETDAKKRHFTMAENIYTEIPHQSLFIFWGLHETNLIITSSKLHFLLMVWFTPIAQKQV